MKLELFEIHPILRPFVERVWLFESSYCMHPDDLRMVTPSGKAVLIYTIKGNYQTSLVDGHAHFTSSGSFTLVGQQSCALRLEGNEPVTSLGICFTPTGAYRFFAGHLFDARNLVLSLEDVYYGEARVLAEKMFEQKSNRGKAMLLQSFLISKLMPAKTQEETVDGVVARIVNSRGLVSLTQLCEETGWSKRHLNRTFSEIVGQSIKPWLLVERFRHAYLLLQKDDMEKRDAVKDFYLSYYDQAHFIHSIKKITGKTPTQLMCAVNQFGNYFNRIE